MKAGNVTYWKQREAARRMSAVARAKRHPRLAAGLQRRVSLVGGAGKWKIVNLDKSFAAMAKRAKSAR